MKKRTLVTAAAVAAASIATYFIRKKIVSKRRKDSEPSSEPNSRHMTDAFSKAKSIPNPEIRTM
jgi:hypothetical protein